MQLHQSKIVFHTHFGFLM